MLMGYRSSKVPYSVLPQSWALQPETSLRRGSMKWHVYMQRGEWLRSRTLRKV